MKKYKEIYSQVPRLTVEVPLKVDDGFAFTFWEIDPYRNLWHIPGGTVYFGENLEQAVERPSCRSEEASDSRIRPSEG